MYYLFFLYFAFSSLFVLALYRLFFHPLCGYPGPTLAALTDWYQAYYNIVKGGGLIVKYDQLHKLHGPVIRVGPNTLHFNDRQAYHDIYTYRSTLVKHSGLYDALGVHAPNSSIIFSDPEVAKQRRVISLEYTIQQKIDKLLDVLTNNYNSSSKTVSMAVAYRALTTDVITSYCFAESANVLDSPGLSHPILQGVKETIKKFWLQIHFPFFMTFALNAPQKLILWFLPEFEGYLMMKAGFERQINSLIKNPDTLLTDQEPLSKASLMDEAFILVAAGSDTVGNTCYVGTFYALKYPSIRQKLKEELEEAWVDKDRPMSYTALEKLPYLTAFIKEALRVSLGSCIPFLTVVAMSVKFLHTNPDVFPDPYTFNPDWWLAQDTSELLLDLAPFSKGPRICLAWCELYLIFGNILRRLDLKLHITEDTIGDFRADKCADYWVPLWEKEYQVFAQNL
ncbi:cytochrome P450, partial [Rhodocollybia butyracea]